MNAADEARKLGDKIKALHVHDSIEGMDMHLMPYYGRIDWKDFGRALKEIEFDGVFSLETGPSVKLSADLYEKSAIVLAQIAKEITLGV